LYWYNSRWYDPALGRFAQADTVIPDQYHPSDWDRYQYVRSNPLRYFDPSGHITCGRDGGLVDRCTPENDPFTREELEDAVKYEYDIDLSLSDIFTPDHSQYPSIEAGPPVTPQEGIESFNGTFIHIPYPSLDLYELTDLDKLNVVVDVAGIAGDISLFIPGAQGADGIATILEEGAIIIEAYIAVVEKDPSGIYLEMIKLTAQKTLEYNLSRKGARLIPLVGSGVSIVDIYLTTKDAWYRNEYVVPIHY
jgi:hypothetical protein